jgi:hypothetical protein
MKPRVDVVDAEPDLAAVAVTRGGLPSDDAVISRPEKSRPPQLARATSTSTAAPASTNSSLSAARAA